MKKYVLPLIVYFTMTGSLFAQQSINNFANDDAVLLQKENPIVQLKKPILQITDYSHSNPKSLTGSYVEFAPGEGGDSGYIPETPQQFIFYSYTSSPDWEYGYNVWLKFPDDWTVTNVEVHGTPTCGAGTWGTFSYTLDADNIANIAHARYHSNGGDWCGAYYLVSVIPGAIIGDANVSWYYDGDGYAGEPHWPCSSDGFTPDGQQPCNELINPPAVIPMFDPVTTYWEQLSIGPSGYASQDFEESNNMYDCILADDFVVTGGPWNINKVKTYGQYAGSGPLEFINVHFYEDNGGSPGSLITEFLSVPCETDLKSGFVTAYLPDYVTLEDGTYWIGIAARMDYATGGQWWLYESTTTNGEHFHWINPENGFLTGATNWTNGNLVWATSLNDIIIGLYNEFIIIPKYPVNFIVTDGVDPIQGATISIVGFDDLITNASGFASILLEDGTYEYSVTADGFYSLTEQTFEVNGADLDLDIELVNIPEYIVTFIVTDGVDPIVGATISITDHGNLVTNESGVALISLYDGSYEYSITADGFYDLTGQTFEVNGADLDIDIELIIIPKYVVTFFVSDGTDAIEGANINISGHGTIVTNNLGVAVTELSNGSYSCVVTATGFVAQNVNFQVDGADLNVDVELNEILTYPIIYAQHELITHPDMAMDGYDASVLQTSLSLSTLGGGFQIANNNSIADDFSIPADEIWIVKGFNFFAYQTGSTTTSSITDVRLKVYNGAPNDGGTVIADYWTGGVMTFTSWSEIYRTQESDIATATNRPIMLVVTAISDLELAEGNYWVEVSMAGSLASGPWCPPRTLIGEITTGNALQNLNGVWQNFQDTGTNSQQGLPFDILGEIQSSPVYYNVVFNVEGVNGSIIAEVDGAEITSGDNIEEGKDVVFTATPDEGYKIKEWVLNGNIVEDYTGLVFTVNGLSEDIVVTVEFEEGVTPPDTYSVTFSVFGSNGTLIAEVDGAEITSGDDVEEGKNVVFTATPISGYKVKRWILNEVPLAVTTNIYTYEALDQTIDVKVEFMLITTGIDDLHVAKINIYPNPARNTTTILSDVNINKVTIISITGDIVSEHSVNAKQYELNISKLSSGLYLLKITTENGVLTKPLQVN